MGLRGAIELERAIAEKASQASVLETPAPEVDDERPMPGVYL